MNGMNGGNMSGGMVGLPTPAGHQTELNYIYGMVEELSRQLGDNRRAMEEIVSGLGRLRNRARVQSMSNEELINAASDEINSMSRTPSHLPSGCPFSCRRF
jgi:Asp-tRNA(Asn)/Glu-tRNA(Gln) amidotransferase C subunit